MAFVFSGEKRFLYVKNEGNSLNRPEKLCQGRGSWQRFCSHQHISGRIVRTSLEKQLDPRGLIDPLEGSAPNFSRKPITIFQGMSGPPVPSTLCVNGTNLFCCNHCKLNNVQPHEVCKIWNLCKFAQVSYFAHFSHTCTITCFLRSLLFWTCQIFLAHSWIFYKVHLESHCIDGRISHTLRTYATKYFPCWNFFNTLHTFCFMHGLSIYEIKRICHRAYFFRISYGGF